MKSAESFAKFAQRAATAGTGYVYGALGQICTTALLDQKARQYPDDNLAGGAMRRVGDKWIGHRVTDCIGLLKWYLMTDKFGDDPHYIAAYDHGANQHYAEAREKGPMSTLSEIPGICLHMDGHFGVYIGNGLAIEARGTYYGVVKTRVANRPWTAWFKSIWLDYSASAPSYTCDTSGTVTIARGTAYQVEITAADTPQVVAGTTDIVTVLPRNSSGNKWYYYIVPIGRPGGKVGIYINGGPRQFIVEIK
jgi:hypothetical protein